MTTKNAKAEMMKAREAAIAALDAKLGNLPEWQIFRSIDRALVALEPESSPLPVVRHKPRLRLNGPVIQPSYMSLADRALTEAGKPMTTFAIVDYIGKHRLLTGDPSKTRIVIQSSLSKDIRFKNVPWQGGRAWWYADKPLPEIGAAG
jgi:hypothetical protein